MNYKRMEALVAIDRFNNISQAAHYLNVKQPTVSFHMKSLEDELGVTLFLHHSSKTTLNEAGKALLFYAHKIINLSVDARNTMNGFYSKEGYNIAIGSSNVAAIYILPKIISHFKDMHSKLSISITVHSAPEIQKLTLDHKISLGIVSSNYLLLDDLQSSRLCTDEMVIVYSNNHPLSQVDQLSKDLLLKQRFILHNSNSTTRMLCDQWAKDIGVTLKPYLEISSAEAIKKAVLLNIGVSILSKLAVQEEIDAGTLCYSYLPEYSPSRNIYVVYNKNRYMPSILKDFIHLLEQWDYQN